ncbi:hypothetical protein TRFO_23129 [Tritrichomonas foetus]|uniref:Uncharacterized protein n=1 Tax=Tritrichomonas foetus TaxID=1144522 RepID=A0A1J4KAH0_9EUKA|nr:hypothetical protein TRFO_23129 [Tritrichomonas foetus]|eukprot:OHT08433.1 hypothetical protein TRFO_23129 [Tritrichomonas foetus]
MSSPGSSRTISNPMIELDKLLRSTIIRAEKILSTAKNTNMSPFSCRANFLRKIQEVRILVSRLVVVFRWSKSINFTDSINQMLTGPEVHFQTVFNEINSLFNTFKTRSRSSPNNNNDIHHDFNNVNSNLSNMNNCEINNILNMNNSKRVLNFSNLFVSGLNYKTPAKITIDRKFAFSNLLLRDVPKRIKHVYFIGHHIFFIAPGEYSFVLKAYSFEKFKIKQYKVNWPRNFHIKDTFLLALTRLLQLFTAQINLTLPRIDRVLHSIYLCGIFLKIAKQFSDKQSNFPLTIESIYSRCIKISFPPLYGNLSSFFMYIQMGKIIFTSMGTVYIPESTFANSLLPLETFSRFSTDVTKDAEITRRQITFTLDHNFANPELLLAFFRDIVFYTKFIKIWNTTIHAIRSVSFAFYSAKMIFNNNMSTLGRIEVFLNKMNLMTISIDSWTGIMKLCFSEYVGIDSKEMTFNFIEPEAISRLMSKVLTNFIIHASVDYAYGSKSPANVFLKNPKTYQRRFSFAPDYTLHIQSDFGHPRIFIFDKDFNQYTNPDIVEMDSSSMIYAWQMFLRTLKSARSLIFLLQTQKYLHSLGIRSVRSGLALELTLQSCKTCNITVNHFGWRLMFSPYFMIGITRSEPISVIHGFGFSARAALLIAQIVATIQQSRSNVLNVIVLSRQTNAIEQLHQSVTYSFSFRFQNESKTTLYFSYGRYLKNCGIHREMNHLILNPCFLPHFQFVLARHSPLQNMINNIVKESTDGYALSSFINHSAIPLFRFLDIFCNPYLNDYNGDFVVSNISTMAQFTLVYKKKFTLSIRLKAVHSFLIFVPTRFPNILLFLPLNIVKKETPFPGKRYFEIGMNSLVNFKNVLIKFTTFYEEIEQLGFTYRAFSEKMDMAMFIRDRDGIHIKLYLKGNEFIPFIENNKDASENLKKLTFEAKLNPLMIRGIIRLVNAFSPNSECIVAIFNLIYQLKNELKYSIEIVINALLSISNDSEGLITMKIDDYALGFEKGSTFKITYRKSGKEPEEIINIQQLLSLINQQDIFSVI